MEKLRGDHGRAMDICVQQLRQQDSNGIEVKDMETEGDGETASSHTSEGEIENNDETLRKSRVKPVFHFNRIVAKRISLFPEH
jgi:hypothetical protein